MPEVKRLRELEQENARLKRIVAERDLVLNEFAFCEDYNVVTAEHHSWAEVAGYY